MVAWDDTADKKMLLNIMQIHGVTNLQWAQIAASMGEGYSIESVKSRYKKIKKDVGAQGDGPPATPVKRGKKGANGDGEGEKSTGAKKSAAGSKRKSAKKAAAEEDAVAGDDEDDAEQTPSKKLKVDVKEEKSEGSGEDLV